MRLARTLLGGATVRLTLGLAATATAMPRSPQPVHQPPKSYYLALGDSIAYGYQPTRKPGARPTAFHTGYVDVFAARLRKLSPGSVQLGRARLCALTFICSKSDPHPTDAGYRAPADAVMAASGYGRKP